MTIAITDEQMCQPCQIKLTSENFIIIKYILHKTLFAVDPDRGATVCKGMGSDSSSDAHHFCILKLSNFDVANASDVIHCLPRSIYGLHPTSLDVMEFAHIHVIHATQFVAVHKSRIQTKKPVIAKIGRRFILWHPIHQWVEIFFNHPLDPHRPDECHTNVAC